MEIVVSKTGKGTSRVTLGIIATLMAGSTALAQEEGGGDLRSAVQNPISAMYSLPFKFTFDNGADNGTADILNIQPVIPVTVGNWNLVSRIIIPYINLNGVQPSIPENPSPEPGTGASGIGDINYSVFFSPTKPSKVTWGIGPSISFPTAEDDQLGSGRYLAGPSAVALTQPSWGTIGALVRQLWSVDDSTDRADVSQFLIEPFLNYNLSNGWYLLTDMVITANWKAPEGQEWTVPVGGGAGKLFTIGKQPINARAEAYYNVERPEGAPEWSFGFTIQFLFPRS